jgi:hypothetical protein
MKEDEDEEEEEEEDEEAPSLYPLGALNSGGDRMRLASCESGSESAMVP